jgi:hypothetical protein
MNPSRDRFSFSSSSKRPETTKRSETKGKQRFWGYVVNVHDAINFDIDLIFPPDLESTQQYSIAITNIYTYQNTNANANNTTEEINEGSTYRCRLKGVGMQKSNGRPDGRPDGRPEKKTEENRLSREAHIAMIKQLDRQNGWVLVEISAVDVYRRLLVTLFDPITGDNLSSILFRPEFEKVFIRHQKSSNWPVGRPVGRPIGNPIIRPIGFPIGNQR